MPRKWRLAKAFAHFNATARSKRWSWTARSADGKTVVITLWEDRLNLRGKPIVYSDLQSP